MINEPNVKKEAVHASLEQLRTNGVVEEAQIIQTYIDALELEKEKLQTLLQRQYSLNYDNTIYTIPPKPFLRKPDTNK